MHRRIALTAALVLLLAAPVLAQSGATVYLPLVQQPAATPAIQPSATIQPTATATTTPTPTTTPIPALLLPNGDFEQGAVIWTPTIGLERIVITNPPAPVTPHSGVWVARLTASQDGSEGSAIDAVGVTVPANAPYLSYWVWVRSSEPTCGDDLGGVGISRGGSATAIDRIELCATSQTDRWHNRVIDLSAYVGQTVTIELLAGTFDTATPDSYLFVDDVAWTATGSPLFTAGQDRYNCSDFSTWQQADAVYQANLPGDPNKLDQDSDGVPCETLLGAPK